MVRRCPAASRLLLVVVLLLGAVVLAAGCARRGPSVRYTPGPDGVPHRGGRALFVREEDPDYLDPALSYGTFSSPVLEGVFRTLLEYADAPGPAGSKIIPELAVGMPDVREGGTLYCFRVRPDARFGAPLHRHITAADFKYAFERLFRVGSPGINFYLGVVGAQAMLAHKTPADTAIAGVIARGDSLYFRLLAPDPIFLAVVAMPFTAPIPREIDVAFPNAFTQHAVSSGPFEVAEFTPRRRLLLVHNPDYCGNPAWLDTFEVTLGVSATNAVALIRRGEVDGGFFELPAGDFARMHRDSVWKRQLQIADGLNTEYLFMNTTLKPFSDLRVRQAINWAVDRRAVLKVWSGKGVVAGELLPPGMPGARIWHFYQGPDTARARALLRAAGYPNGFSTKLYGWTFQPGPRELTLVQEQLAEVGIRAELDLGETAGYTSMASRTANHIPFGVYSWYADYVDPENFFDQLMNGHHIPAVNNQNLSCFDDPRVNALIARAADMPNGPARDLVWQEADSVTMEAAPIVPLVHALESRIFAPRMGGWYRHVTRILKIDRLYVKTPLPAAAVATR